MPDMEEAQSFLNGVTRDSDALYEHLTKVLLKIVKEKPTDVFDSFESLSVQVKNETASSAALNQDAAVADAKEDPTVLLAAAQKTLDLIKPPKKKPAGEYEEEEEEEEEPEKAAIPDVMQNMGLLQWAGLGMEEEEAYRVMLSVQTLATKNELQNVRFWGKIQGTEKDYYIVEARQEEYPEPEEGNEPPPKQEALGTGTNECIYFATNSPEEAWTKLNVVQPEQIIAARNMRRFFTGNLDAPVLGFPRFPWGEAAYLRTQIARISADTTLAPKGQFNVDGDEGEEQTVADNEEWAGINVLVADEGDYWTHARSGIMSEGRTTAWVDPDKEEEEEDEEEMSEEKKAALAAKEKPRRKLAEISEDGSDAEPAWCFRVQPSKYDQNAVACVHSLQWPGAFSVARKKQVLNFYMGWGMSYSNTPYQPPLPPAFATEFSSNFDAAAAPEGAADPLLEQTDPMPPPGTMLEEPTEDADDDDDDDDDEDEAGAEAGDEGDEEEN